MNYPSHIYTIEKFNEFSLKEKGSLFISRIFNVSTEKQVSEIINSIKKEFYDASHHCYAYKLINGKFKYSDDGEPNGSAGIRIFNLIDSYSLTDQLILVIRYFGGTKLGIGPLGKAYSEAAKGVINNSEIKEKFLYELITIQSEFELVSNIYHCLNQNKARIVKEEYFNNVVFSAFLQPEKFESVSGFLRELSKNRVKIRKSSKVEYL